MDYAESAVGTVRRTESWRPLATPRLASYAMLVFFVLSVCGRSCVHPAYGTLRLISAYDCPGIAKCCKHCVLYRALARALRPYCRQLHQQPKRRHSGGMRQQTL